jgi:hypothetical protein
MSSSNITTVKIWRKSLSIRHYPARDFAIARYAAPCYVCCNIRSAPGLASLTHVHAVETPRSAATLAGCDRRIQHLGLHATKRPCISGALCSVIRVFFLANGRSRRTRCLLPP